MISRVHRDNPGQASEVKMATLVHTIPEACSGAKIGRTALYEAIRSGALRAVKRGRRTLILDEDLRHWVQSLPAMGNSPSISPQHRGG
jgi:excisionase family DNA binding protein